MIKNFCNYNSTVHNEELHAIYKTSNMKGVFCAPKPYFPMLGHICHFSFVVWYSYIDP